MEYFCIVTNENRRLARSDSPPQETWEVRHCPVCAQNRYLSEPVWVLSPTGEWVQERLCTGHNAIARISDDEAEAYMSHDAPRIPR